METLQVRPSDTRDIVLRAMKAKRPIFLWGPPGIGKSELVQQIVDSGELGNAYMIDMRLALMEPTDLRGYPFRNPETNQMEWAPPADLPTQELADSYDTIVIFLDELNSAPPSVQAAAYQLVLNGRIVNMFYLVMLKLLPLVTVRLIEVLHTECQVRWQTDLDTLTWK